MRTGIKYLAVLALIVALASGYTRTVTQTATITTPTGALSARDSVGVDTLTIGWGSYDVAKLEVSCDLTSMTRIDYQLYASDDNAATFTQLTEARDSIWGITAIGASGEVRCTADTMATYWIARPMMYATSDSMVAQRTTLDGATHLRLVWNKNVGIDVNDTPDIQLQYWLYQGFPWQ